MTLVNKEPGKKVSVIGAAGRVGFALSLVLANNDHQVWGIDKNEDANQRILRGIVPFVEIGAHKYLQTALEQGNLSMTADFSAVSQTEIIVVVLGTPIDENFNPVLKPLLQLFSELTTYLRHGQLIILRSTVAPGTTELLNQRIEASTSWQSDRDFFLAYAPERVAEGHAIAELTAFPQLIGAFGDEGYRRAETFFQSFANVPCLRLTPREAEIGKLITNMARYVQFALANEFYLICDAFGVNAHKVFDACNYEYPRLALPTPGPNVGGPCLYKDGFFLLEKFPFTELITQAFKINEAMPMQIVQKLQAHGGIRKVSILGLAFKADIDDTRNSLSFRLKKQLENNGYELVLIDPWVAGYTDLNHISGSDCVVLMTPHSQFKDLRQLKKLVCNDNCLMVDIWGFWNEMRCKSRNGLFYLREV